MSIFVLGLATLLLTGSAGPSNNGVAQAADAVVTVLSGTSVGTGFVSGPGEVVTAAHVVGDRRQVDVLFGGRTFGADVISLDPAVDLALLLVVDTEWPVLVLAEAVPDIGEGLVVFSASDGVVAATRGVVSAYETIGGVPHLRTDAAVNTGSSGGPVINSMGRVIGVTVTKVEGREGIAYAVTAPVVREFLTNRPVAMLTPATDKIPSSIAPWGIGGVAILLAGFGGLVLTRRNERQDEIQLGRSRIRIDADTLTHVSTGETDGP